MEVLGLSTITNLAAGMGTEPLDHEEVLDMGQKVGENLKKLICAIVRET
jgi:purine-nucleoside phosphorylase